MAENRPVVAVIPHYNMSDTLSPLILQAIDQNYDGIYVLDDHSTKCDVSQVVEPFGAAVTLVAGKENRGAGCNRNRILEVDPGLLGGSILHFIDADCELLTDDIPSKARQLFEDDKLGAVGGLIRNADNSLYAYNYNPRISLNWSFAVCLQGLLASTMKGNPARARTIHAAFKKVLEGFPDLQAEPMPRSVFCVTEANMLMPYETFRMIDGFDERLRYHEAQDLAHKLAAKGLIERWDPSIEVKHRAVSVRGNARILENWKSAYIISRKYGLPIK